MDSGSNSSNSNSIANSNDEKKVLKEKPTAATTKTAATRTQKKVMTKKKESPCLLFAIDFWNEQYKLDIENYGVGIGSDGQVK